MPFNLFRLGFAATIVSTSSSLLANAFVSPSTGLSNKPFIHSSKSNIYNKPTTPPQLLWDKERPCQTALHMYNLPPSGGGGGGGGPKSDLQQIMGSVLTIAGVVLFFASPLGSIFFAITNSLLLLTFITPLILVAGFQVWQTFNTIEAPCPNCGAPTRVIKDPESPAICFNCGAILQISADQESIEIADVNSRANDFIDSDVGVSGGGGSIFDALIQSDFFGSDSPTTTTSSSSEEAKQKQKQFIRDRTIIDVDVEKD